MTTQTQTFTPSLIDTARALSGPVVRIVGLIARTPQLARGRLRVWQMRLDDRAYLADLKPHQLGDIRMTPDQRASEASKPFWVA